MHSELNCIGRSVLFNNMSIAEKEKLLTTSSHRQYYAKGALIRQPNDQFNGLLIIDQGLTKAYQVAENGKEKILYVLKSGDVSGQQYLFTKHTNLTMYLEALEDTWVCSIQYNDFQDLLRKDPAISLALLNNFGNMIVGFEEQNVRRDLLDAEDRVMDYFKQQCIQNETDQFILPLKKKELAGYLGITPETLSRKMKALEDKQRIKVDGKQITVFVE